MLKVHLSRELLGVIDEVRGSLSRPVYMIKCLKYVIKSDISLEEIEDVINRDSRIRGDNNDRVSETLQERENRNSSRV